MIASRQWSVDIFIDEHEDERTTRAEARLHTNDKTDLVGRGTARRNPHDTDVAEIGDELAVARALSNLAHELLDAAASDIEQVTHEHIRLHN
jgi:Rv2632c-like